MAGVMAGAQAGALAFREAYLADDPNYIDFNSFEGRRMRYQILWSVYENTAYSNVHNWAQRYRIEYGLYKYTRGIYNPAARLGDFWQTHLWGGALDPDAGNGKQIASSLPIIVPDENKAKETELRQAIATLWRLSSWATKKDLIALTGAVLGDVGVKIVDDPESEKAYMKMVHPSTIRDLEMDDWGNVKGYWLEELRFDPEDDNPELIRRRKVIYTETASRTKGSDTVTYKTYRNGKLYPWNGVASSWTEEYGFVPFVFIKHIETVSGIVGANNWGWAEIYPALAKVREVDDVASKLSDQIRKYVDPMYFFAGVSEMKDGSKKKVTNTKPADGSPQPGREEINALYGPQGATATPLVAALDITGTIAHIDHMIAEIERDFPELQMDIWRATGDASGRALRVARQRTEKKVGRRRAVYDDALVRAQMMGVAIGGERKYPGFEGFNLASYQNKELDHAIGNRPIFYVDPMDVIAEDQAFWTAAKTAEDAGYPLELFLKDHGYTEEQLKELPLAKMAAIKLQQEDAIPPDGTGQKPMNGAQQAPNTNQAKKDENYLPDELKQ